MHAKDRHKRIPAVYLILKQKNRIFLMQRARTGYEDGKYDFISGHIDELESPTEAIIREAQEEMGIVVNKKDLKIVHVMARAKTDHERIDFFFLAKKWEGEPHIMEDKCDAIGWFEISDLPKNFIKPVKQAFENILNKEFYSEYGW